MITTSKSVVLQNLSNAIIQASEQKEGIEIF